MRKKIALFLSKDPPLFLLLGLLLLCYTPLAFLDGSQASFGLETGRALTWISNFYNGIDYVPYTVGFPVYELITILTYPLLGMTGFSILTVLISIISLYFLNQLLVHLTIKHRYFIIASVALHPWYWIHATIMIENNWALLFGILGLYHFFKNRNGLSILFLSLAIGTRIPFFIFSLSLMTLSFFVEKNQFKRFFFIGGLSWFMGGLYYLRALHFYDWNVFKFLYHNGGPDFEAWTLLDHLIRFVYKGFYFFGLPFWIVLVSFLFIKRCPLNFKMNTLILKSSFLIVIYHCVIFLKYPAQPDYLFPAFPFLLIIISKLFDNQKVLWSLFVGLFLLNLVNFNVLKPDVPLNATSAQWGFWIEKGILLKDVSKRVSTPPKLF